MHSFKWGKRGAYEIASPLPPETDWVRISLKNECLNKSWDGVLACDVCWSLWAEYSSYGDRTGVPRSVWAQHIDRRDGNQGGEEFGSQLCKSLWAVKRLEVPDPAKGMGGAV